MSEATFVYRCLKLFGTPVLRLFFRLRGEGTDNIPPAGPFILAANHVSFIDPLVLGATCPRAVHYIMLKEYYDKPVIGWLSRKAGSFPVDPEGPTAGALRNALRILQEGKVLGIFPEGGRSMADAPLPAKEGVALLSVKGGFPLVPAAILGADRALPRGQTLPRPVRVTVRYGRPLTFERPSREAKKDYLGEVTRRTMEAIAALSRE